MLINPFISNQPLHFVIELFQDTTYWGYHVTARNKRLLHTTHSDADFTNMAARAKCRILRAPSDNKLQLAALACLGTWKWPHLVRAREGLERVINDDTFR